MSTNNIRGFHPLSVIVITIAILCESQIAQALPSSPLTTVQLTRESTVNGVILDRSVSVFTGKPGVPKRRVGGGSR